jgi:hypothetical protein
MDIILGLLQLIGTPFIARIYQEAFLLALGETTSMEIYGQQAIAGGFSLWEMLQTIRL